MQSADSIGERIVLVTATKYSSASIDLNRYQCAIQTVQSAVASGIECVVIDASDDNTRHHFSLAGARVFEEQDKGMGAGRRQGIRAAYDTHRPVIAWAEPEKFSYVPFLPSTASPIVQGRADLVVPARVSLQSYPTAQAYAELLGNLVWHQITGVPLDMWFGPRTWSRESSRYFLEYDGKYGDLWDSLHVPVLDAIIDGRRVVSVSVDYEHPPVQKRDEENDPLFSVKRLAQLNNLVPAFMDRWSSRSLGKPNS